MWVRGFAGVAPQPDTAPSSLPDRGSAQADGDTYQELCALQL